MAGEIHEVILSGDGDYSMMFPTNSLVAQRNYWPSLDE